MTDEINLTKLMQSEYGKQPGVFEFEFGKYCGRLHGKKDGGELQRLACEKADAHGLQGHRRDRFIAGFHESALAAEPLVKIVSKGRRTRR